MTVAKGAPRQRRAPGERSRARVLDHATKLATIEGLEGLSVGRLAEASGMPKSSVYVLFGSKEQLQLETVDAARTSFLEEVVLPALRGGEPGLAQLRALCKGYLSYVERRVFPGGCFFVAASAELGARPGHLHDRVAAYQQQWRDLLQAQSQAARDAGDLRDECDPAQLAFELGTLLAGTNVLSVLHDDQSMIERARAALDDRLDRERAR